MRVGKWCTVTVTDGDGKRYSVDVNADSSYDAAHLYLWVPNALLAEGLAVMESWGFTYKTNLVWFKTRKDGGPDGRGVALTQNTTWDNRVSFYPDGFVADKCWQEANVEQMRHADYLLLRYSPPTFPEWDGSTRAYVLSHFTLAVRHPNGRQPFELWKRTTPRAHGGAAPQTKANAQRRLQQAADALVQRP